MNITDPISDMLTRIRNATAVKKAEVVLPYSKLKLSLAKLFVDQSWLERAEESEQDGRKVLRLLLKYDPTGMPVISGIMRVSKPGQRIYARSAQIPRVSTGTGITVVSTSRGLMTDRQARAEKVGGEIICQIW